MYGENPPEDLKQRINNLMWVCLPSETSLQEAERVANQIYGEVLAVWNKRPQPAKELK